MIGFLREHIPSMDAIKGRYIEPFLGGGSVYFLLCRQPWRAILSDIDPHIIETYRAVRRSPRAVWEIYRSFGDTRDDYYYVRDEFHPHSRAARAARILYLNRTCFKGQWRFNENGALNVGYGGPKGRWAISLEDFIMCATLLRGATLLLEGFWPVINKADEGDFIFLDPPYSPGEREAKEKYYHARWFTYSDYEALAVAAARAKDRGAAWALTISSHPDIVQLFKGNYVLRFPFGTGDKPGLLTWNAGDVLITSYPTEGGTII